MNQFAKVFMLIPAIAGSMLINPIAGFADSIAIGFTDVLSSNPYSTYINHLQQQNMISGTGNGKFDPNGPLTRAQFAKLLATAFGLPLDTHPTHFLDLEGHWAAAYIQTAFSNGIVKGDSNTTFGPDKPVLREEAATMVWRYLTSHGVPPVTSPTVLTDHTDSWAAEAVQGILTKGIYGPDVLNGNYRPHDIMTREEAAALIDLAIQRESSKTLVALGDSITFGYNLDPNNDQPSKHAFPYLIGTAENYQVTNLGTPGWTSKDLLAALQTPQFQEDIKHADVITLDIGSNDLLNLAEPVFNYPDQSMTPQDQTEFTQFRENLTSILHNIKQLSPNAKIVLYNLYDPISSASDPLYKLSNTLIQAENQIIAGTAAQFGIPIADAYTAFATSSFVLPGDIHPTIVGQEELAKLGEAALQAVATD